MGILHGGCSLVRRSCAALVFDRLHLPLLIAVFLVGASARAGAQSAPDQQDALRQHYEAAAQYQAAGDHERAAVEYSAFLAEAMHRIANGEAVAGRFDEAITLFEEALKFAPQDNSVRLDYARVCLDAEKLPQAKTLAEEAVRSDPKDAQARFLLGSVLFHMEDFAAARVQLEAAVAANPDFKTGYLLGRTYLILHQETLARQLFNDMVAGLGDTALIHIYFGRAYSLMDYPGQAVAEFKKAIALDSHAIDAHYYLALAYLRHDESAGYDKAIPEFQAELKVNPNDVRSRYMLGYIALKQNRFTDAEMELSQAAALQPQDFNTLVNLAEAYIGENRLNDAEATLRKAIQVAGNNPAQKTGRAHYLLGRLLMKTGREQESKQEMAVSAQQADTRGMSSGPAVEARVISSSSLAQQEQQDRSGAPAGSSSDELKGVEEMKSQLSPLVAEGYNNLGALAAEKQQYVIAVSFFEKASTWDPRLDGLDRNLGMAAFYAKEYSKVPQPLSRYLESHPNDQAARSALEDAKKQLEAGKP